MRKLYKSRTNRIISGVIGGLGDYYDIDPTLLRLAALLIIIVTGLFPGVIVYIVAALIVPRQP